MTQNYQQNLEKVKNMIQDIDIAMLTTMDDNNLLRSRPMATTGADFDGSLYFLTRADAPKVGEVNQLRHVNVSYADPENGLFVSVSGVAHMEKDQRKIEQVWDARFEKWLPGGPNDERLALLRVDVEYVEYWSGTSDALGTVIDFRRSSVTDKKPE
jgi:general stress protein 26